MVAPLTTQQSTILLILAEMLEELHGFGARFVPFNAFK
jgi:hypothetical protein